MPSLIHKKNDGTTRTLEFGTKPLIVGRLNESDIPVADSFVSRVHCGFIYAKSQFTLKDLGSTNGTYRNGARVYECGLQTGDRIQVGNATLLFEIDTASGNATVSQTGAAAVAAPGSAESRPDLRRMTAPVKLPGQKPASLPAQPGPRPS